MDDMPRHARINGKTRFPPPRLLPPAVPSAFALLHQPDDPGPPPKPRVDRVRVYTLAALLVWCIVVVMVALTAAMIALGVFRYLAEAVAR